MGELKKVHCVAFTEFMVIFFIGLIRIGFVYDEM